MLSYGRRRAFIGSCCMATALPGAVCCARWPRSLPLRHSPGALASGLWRWSSLATCHSVLHPLVEYADGAFLRMHVQLQCVSGGVSCCVQAGTRTCTSAAPRTLCAGQNPCALLPDVCPWQLPYTAAGVKVYSTPQPPAPAFTPACIWTATELVHLCRDPQEPHPRLHVCHTWCL